MKKLRDKISEVAKIAEECPDNFQQICFELLLKHVLAAEERPDEPSAISRAQQEKQEPTSVVEELGQKQDDLSDRDLHVKARRFLDKYSLTVAELNQLFYKQGDEVLPLYDELKTTRTSESQIRITLLQCLLSAIRTGDFQTSVEAAKDEAETRKCYDKNNWNNNYTNSASLFDFDKYSRQVKTITLSEEGKSQLAAVVKELQ